MVDVGELEVGIGNEGQGCQVVVLGCSMTRRKSRVCIELGVQALCLLCLRKMNEMIEKDERYRDGDD
ncbi:hypothetical protein PIB30_038503 [Stylosanthes scabra]|uniref:Uncharacterized protein n=1 Tax=Stylosanthes scabra TaxID=79078 RepID=A0ABU6SDZ7_9FABA|nr:hypothetical protein [Stylosanthes scabra]